VGTDYIDCNPTPIVTTKLSVRSGSKLSRSLLWY